MRGRKPKSAAAKALAGNPGKRKAKAAPPPEPVIRGEFDPPAHLSPPALVVWLEEMPRLRQLRLLKPTDLAAFAVYCEAAGRYRTASAVVAERGMTYESVSKHGSMVRVRPEVGVMERAERIMRQFMSELGMTSKARVQTLATQGRGDQPNLPGLEPAAGSQTKTVRGDDDPIGYLQ
ncbi:MAG TPA: phage terminase small subunit P27 family [Azospirillaceae bacterium]|nr:phage terminase small subunit P27 family [Azospirillaceae bacterium]